MNASLLCIQKALGSRKQGWQVPWEVGLGGALIGEAGPVTLREARGSLNSWMQDRVLLKDRAPSWGQLGRAGWSAVEGGVVGGQGSPNLLSDQPRGHSEY